MGARVCKPTAIVVGTLLIFGLIAGTGAPPARADGITVNVCITDSHGNKIVPDTTYYKLGSISFFSNTVGSDSCKYQDFPAGTTNLEVWTTYNHTTSTHLTQNITTKPVFNFSTNSLTLRLETCGGTGLAGGTARFGSGGVYVTSNFPGNPTGATGEASAELFPGTYSFDMTYQATSQQKLSVAVPDSNTTLTWRTTNVTITYPGSVSYGGSLGDSTWFKQTTAPASKELLPGTVRFHYRGSITTDLVISGCSFTDGDQTPPVVGVTPTGSPGTNGWYTSDVDVTVQADDTSTGGSTIASIACPDFPFTSETGIATPMASGLFSLADQGETKVSCTATDTAGNTSDPVTLTIKIDSKAPTLSPVVTPNPVQLGSAATATSGAEDSTSGIASESCGIVDTTTVGDHTVTCTAIDMAGNTTTDTVHYQVVYPFAGFFSPVNNPSTWNTAKAGQAIPVKFNLGGDQGLAIFRDGYPKPVPASCETGIASDAIEQYADTSGGSSLSYDPTSTQYTYVWKTQKTWVGKCFSFDLGLQDGVSHPFLVRFLK